MPFATQVPDAIIDLGAETPVLTLSDTLLLNELHDSAAFDRYDVEATGATTLERGDPMTAVDSGGGPVVGGTYAGSGTFGTAEAGITVPNILPTLPPLAELTLQVNNIDVDYMVGEDGTVYVISDQPLDADHIQVTLQLNLAGISVLDTTVPASEIVSTLQGVPGIGPVLDPLTDFVQQTLDTVAVTTAYDPEGELPLSEDEVVPCFVRGTMIETPEGPVPVERLRPGDLVLTRDHGAQPVRWAGSVRLRGAALRANPRLRPIRIRAGALGPCSPEADLLVSPQHRMLIRSKIAARMFGSGEVLVAARQLLILDGIEVAEELAEVEYLHLLLDRHEVVRANGAEAETLYTGPQALKAVGPAAREEILALFPGLLDAAAPPPAARPLPSGRQGRRLAERHRRNRRLPVAG